MTKYETTVVFDGSLPEETIAKEQQKLEAFITEKCELDSVDVWGKKPLAYEIRKRKTGFYCMFTYTFAGDATSLINDEVRYNSHVLRNMTVIHDDVQFIIKKTEEKPAATEEATEGEA